MPLVAGEPCVLVTHGPCVMVEDACVLRVLTHRPAPMAAEAWAWLQQRHFGTLYFPHAGAPRPEDFDGDTDGGLYLLCWDREVVEIASRRVPPRVPPGSVATAQPTAATAAAATEERLGDDWLAQAQAHTRDPSRLREMLLIGRLYREMQRAEDAGSEDYAPLARAYKAAIDHGKHGGELLAACGPAAAPAGEARRYRTEAAGPAACVA